MFMYFPHLCEHRIETKIAPALLGLSELVKNQQCVYTPKMVSPTRLKAHIN